MRLLLTDHFGRSLDIPVNNSDTFEDLIKRANDLHGIQIVFDSLDDCSAFSYKENLINYVSSHCDKAVQIDGEICRLCSSLCPPPLLQPLEKWIERIHMCLPVKVRLDDDLSQFICTQCCKTLEQFSSFVNLCLKTEKVQTLTKHKRKTILVSSEEEKGSKRKEYGCETCSKVFRNIRKFQFHLKTHTQEQDLHLCELCGKHFPSEVCHYKHFVYNHTDRQAFSCDVCNKNFANKGSLRYHSRRHDSEEAKRPFCCNLCGKRFARNNILRDHRLNQHGTETSTEKPFQKLPTKMAAIPTP